MLCWILPNLPTNILNILVDKFKIKPITTAETTLKIYLAKLYKLGFNTPVYYFKYCLFCIIKTIDEDRQKY